MVSSFSAASVGGEGSHCPSALYSAESPYLLNTSPSTDHPVRIFHINRKTLQRVNR